MPKIDLSTKEKICLAGYAVLGKEFLADAFDMCHSVKTKKAESLAVMRSKWIHKPQAKDFVLNIRKQYADSLLDNIGEDTELSEKQLIAIIQRGIVSEKDPKRQSDMSLKLMQWRKDAKAELTEEEKRKYVLPYRAICRVCPLMATFKSVSEGTTVQPAKMIEESRKAQEAARERILSGGKRSGDDKDAEALGWLFSSLGLSDTDCYDILDFLKRQNEGKSISAAHWNRH